MCKRFIRRYSLILVLVVWSNINFAQPNIDSLHQPIINFFNGLSLIDPDVLKENTTSDFILLEAGKIWNNDTLINRIKPLKGTNFKRENKFDFFHTEQNGPIAWVSYWNQAIITREGKISILRWLESVVLIKESDQWKIRMMHSTPIR